MKLPRPRIAATPLRTNTNAHTFDESTSSHRGAFPEQYCGYDSYDDDYGFDDGA
jgi:hypothetical protein